MKSPFAPCVVSRSVLQVALAGASHQPAGVRPTPPVHPRGPPQAHPQRAHLAHAQRRALPLHRLLRQLRLVHHTHLHAYVSQCICMERLCFSDAASSSFFAPLNCLVARTATPFKHTNPTFMCMYLRWLCASACACASLTRQAPPFRSSIWFGCTFLLVQYIRTPTCIQVEAYGRHETPPA